MRRVKGEVITYRLHTDNTYNRSLAIVLHIHSFIHFSFNSHHKALSFLVLIPSCYLFLISDVVIMKHGDHKEALS